jgi:hypothetical protein
MTRSENVMQDNRSLYLAAVALIAAVMIGGTSGQSAAETVQGMLAAQIRTQGFACDKALGAGHQALPARPSSLGAQMQQCGLPGEPRARHGREGRSGPPQGASLDPERLPRQAAGSAMPRSRIAG